MTSKLSPALSRITRAQHGVISRKQASGAGLTDDAVRSRVRRGTWRQVYRGVYLVTTEPVSTDARLWAAVLYCGRGAVLSHQTAAALHGLNVTPSATIHISVPADRKVIAVPGMCIHRTRRPLDPPDGHRDPPHTPICDTLLDLIDAEDNLDAVCAWLTDAFSKDLLHAAQLAFALSERARIRWRGQLTEIVACAARGDHSVLEYRYTRDVERAHRLPEAARQVAFRKADGREGRRDRLYEKYGVIIELDGNVAHPLEKSWADKDRDRAAAAQGKVSLRYGWAHVDAQPCVVAAEVAQVLRHRGWKGRLSPCSPQCPAG
jgi:very-short-patch-repair endonuclease